MIKASVVTASGVVENVSGTLHTVNVTKASASSTVDIYDNASAASGNKLFSGDGNAVMSYPLGNFAGGGVAYTQGLYISFTGTPGIVVVSYE